MRSLIRVICSPPGRLHNIAFRAIESRVIYRIGVLFQAPYHACNPYRSWSYPASKRTALQRTLRLLGLSAFEFRLQILRVALAIDTFASRLIGNNPPSRSMMRAKVRPATISSLHSVYAIDRNIKCLRLLEEELPWVHDCNTPQISFSRLYLSQGSSEFCDISRSNAVRLLVSVINCRVIHGNSVKGQTVLIVQQDYLSSNINYSYKSK